MKSIEFDLNNFQVYFDGKLMPFSKVSCAADVYGGVTCVGIFNGDISKTRMKDFCIMIDYDFSQYKDYIIIEPEMVSLDLLADLKFIHGLDAINEANNYLKFVNFRFPDTPKGNYAKDRFKYYAKRTIIQQRINNIKDMFTEKV